MKRMLPDEAQLLSREQFKAEVFAQNAGLCIFCRRPAVDAHHILERKLFADGGYYLGNGAAVCEEHHWQCETTEVSVETVRLAAGIRMPVLPPGFAAHLVYDKWGNQVWPSGLRTWGPLQDDCGARKALTRGGVLGLLMPPGYSEAPSARKDSK